MNIYRIGIVCSLITLSSCMKIQTNKKEGHALETIVGVAKNAKLGAVIETDRSDVYYMDGMNYWRSKYLNKKVSVTGLVVGIEGHYSNDSIEFSQNTPSRMVIRNAICKLIK
mgnify:CR=1 FL=1